MKMESPRDDATAAAAITSDPQEPLKTEAAPETGRASPADDEAEVWQSFEQSVAYMRNLSALYKDAFLAPARKTAAPTAARAHAAKEHAREAIELLASNLLNASTAIVATLENQEEQLAAVYAKLDRVKRKLRDRERAREQQIIHQFFHEPKEETPTRESGELRQPTGDTRSLKLALASPAAPTSSAPQSMYLYL